MAEQFSFDREKALAAILFISSQVPNIRYHRLMKILYFADLKHLSMYGRTVIGDRYIAMQHGPVPSNVYNMLKAENEYLTWKDKYFSVSFWKHVTPKQDPDMYEFSDSDIECLEFSIKENRNKPWNVLREHSHDNAWNYTWDNLGKNRAIPIDKIIDQSGAGPEIQKYILERINYDSYKFS